MAVVVDDILQANSQVIHGETADLGLNVWSFQVDVVPVGGDADVRDDLLEYVDAFFGEIVALIATEYQGGTIEVFNRTQDEFVGASILSWAGSGTSDALPPTVAALYLGKTNTKRVSGRKYIFGIGQDEDNTGRWVAGAIITFENAITKYVDSFTGTLGGEYTPGVTRTEFGVPSFTPFSGGQFVVNNRTQRSRTIGRGI